MQKRHDTKYVAYVPTFTSTTPSSEFAFNPNHLRVDVAYLKTQGRYEVTAVPVEKKPSGGERQSFEICGGADPMIILEANAKRFNAKKLASYADSIDAQLLDTKHVGAVWVIVHEAARRAGLILEHGHDCATLQCL